MIRLIIISSILSLGLTARADDAQHPCKKIEEICTAAGFVKGEAKEGKGLWRDCIGPIMTGGPQPANAKIGKPTVDPALVQACKAKHPDFGEKMGQGKKH